jgi:hypothetical protein
LSPVCGSFTISLDGGEILMVMGKRIEFGRGRLRGGLMLTAGLASAVLFASAVTAASEPVKSKPPTPEPIGVTQLRPWCVVEGGDVTLAASRVEPGSDVTLQGAGMTSLGEPLYGVSGAADRWAGLCSRWRFDATCRVTPRSPPSC